MIRAAGLDEAVQKKVQAVCIDAGFSGLVAFRDDSRQIWRLSSSNGPTVAPTTIRPRLPCAWARALAAALAAEAGHAETINEPALTGAPSDGPKISPWRSLRAPAAIATTDEGGDKSATELAPVYDVPVNISAVLGGPHGGRVAPEAETRIRVLELDRKVGEAIDIFVNNRLVARGEVVVVEERWA